ncbi:MAG: fibrobacter succinogenes major paralogous domain-containing protein [Bacteroidales bacterium]|nr:fibrobacter succinogenes major paralogous domain-containing protein [Bacteroidales bacterium]
MKKFSFIHFFCLAAIFLFLIGCEKSSTDDPQVFKVIDIDGNKYDTIHIGTQVWLKQNLKVTHYRNGDPVEPILKDSDWFYSESGAWCCYNNDTNNIPIYGCLYNLYAAKDPRGLCPQGWHTPTEDEWRTLVSFLDFEGGYKLREQGTEHWKPTNAGATNSTGFTALPGGKRNPGDASFAEIGSSAYFWTDIIVATTTGDFPRQLMFNENYVNRACYSPKDGLSVRCIMD